MQTYIEIFSRFSIIVDQVQQQILCTFFTNIPLHNDLFKISLYNGVFSYSELIILKIQNNSFGLFCTGYVSEIGKATYIMGVYA